MENKSIIIILVAVILVLACILGVMFLQPNAKQATKVKITSGKSQYEGGDLSIELTDKNKTPISKEVVNVTITNSRGKVVVDNVVKTNSKGKAKLDLHLKKGKYDVNVTYGGNENFTGSNTTQKLTIKEEAPKATESVSSSDTSIREEYKITPDGWNPGEHEVSREKVNNGHERVYYDDGYFRVVDSEGNIITHGWRY